MELSQRQREVVESIVTIGREDICLKEVAYRLGISYEVMMRHLRNAMARNGYVSLYGFLCDFARNEDF